jgi:hypothetical protein
MRAVKGAEKWAVVPGYQVDLNSGDLSYCSGQD